MNDQNQITQIPSPEIAPVTQRQRLSDLLKDVFKNVRQNKKLMRLVIIILGIFVFIITTGLIYSFFGRNRSTATKVLATPTPIQDLNTVVEDEIQTKLKNLKQKILNLDIHQKRLSPPNLDFKVDF